MDHSHVGVGVLPAWWKERRFAAGGHQPQGRTPGHGNPLRDAVGRGRAAAAGQRPGRGDGRGDGDPDGQADRGRLLLAAVLVAASATLLVLNGGGVPTSITLALVGASSGAGFAGGQPNWHLVLRVLGIAVLSPLAAFAISRTIYLLIHSRTPRSSTTMVFLGFLLTCLAYGSNDGQKMIAMFSAAIGTDLDTATHNGAITATVTAAFLAGVLTGMPKGATALQRGTIVPDSRQTWVTLWAASLAVLISSMLGSPVSMTQSISGALIGTCQTND